MSKKTLRCHAKNGFNTSYGKDRQGELRFKRKNAMNELKLHKGFRFIYGGVDSGCLQASVTSRRK